jgi:hypothetical protein
MPFLHGLTSEDDESERHEFIGPAKNGITFRGSGGGEESKSDEVGYDGAFGRKLNCWLG